MAYAVRSSIRLDGVTYRSPDDAYAAAAIVEDAAEQRAAQYRRNGDEGMADTTVDAGRAKAEKLRTWARQREEFEARESTQPADRPSESAPSKPPPSDKRDARASRRRAAAPPPRRRASRRSSLLASPVARRGYRRSGAQAAVASGSGLLWKIAGATIGLAFLTIFLTPKGSGAFAGLAGIAAGALRLVVDPVDPLAPGALDKAVGAKSPQAVAAAASPGAPAAVARANRQLSAGNRAGALATLRAAGFTGNLVAPNRRAPRAAVR